VCVFFLCKCGWCGRLSDSGDVKVVSLDALESGGHFEW
jgi:hypothetical protein